ncbi:MAG: NHLP bacteriocin export ABC transporter permease/ATPase subunit, partial [Acidobacteriota bacterium]
ELVAEQRVVSGRGIVWAHLSAASFRFLDRVELAAATAPIVLPLSARTWVTAEGNATVEACSTADLIEQGQWSGAMERFHSVALELLKVHLDAVYRDEHNRLERKAELLVRDRRAVMNRFRAVFDRRVGRRELDAMVSPLVAACRRIGSALGVKIEAPIEGPAADRSIASQVEEIASLSRLRTRQVVLRHGWWRQESGPMLAFRRDDGAPVALLSGRRGRVPMWTPGTAKLVSVDEGTAAGIDPVAYSFYRTLPDRSLGAIDLLRFSAAVCRRDLLAALVFGAAVALVAMLVPIATGLIIDVSIPTNQPVQLVSIAACLAVAAFAGFGFKVCENIAVLRVKGNVKRALEPAMLDRLLRMPSDFFRRYSPGDLAYRTMTIALIQSQLTGEVLSTLLAGLFSLLNFAIMFYLQPVAAAVALVVLLVLLAGSVWAVYRQQSGLASTQQLRGRLGSLALQMVTGIRRIRLAGAEGRFFVRWGHQFMELREAFFDAYRVRVAFTTMSSGYQILAFAAVFAALAWMSGGSPESLTTGRTLAFLAAFALAMTGFAQMSRTLVELAELVPMYRRVQPLLAHRPVGEAQRAHPGRLSGRIEVNEVFFRYGAGTALVLRGASLQVEPGESIAIVGSSGCGKSTLLRLILGFERPTAGSIYFDGKDLASLDPRQVRRQVGVVLQQDKLMEATIYDNIRGASDISLEEAWQAARMAGIAGEIDAMPLGMHTVISAEGADLSGGQAQRLLIARALAGRPRILILDEATSALDNKAQAKVVASLERLRVTRIAVAHRLSTVQQADRIFVLDGGRVVESGRFDELMAAEGLFADLVRRQLQ